MSKYCATVGPKEVGAVLTKEERETLLTIIDKLLENNVALQLAYTEIAVSSEL